MPEGTFEIIDISMPLTRDYKMHTPSGVADVQLALDVLKDYDAQGGAGQLVRGIRMRLHHGTHVDAPEHFVKGGEQIGDIPLSTFVGPAVIANLTPVSPDTAITPAQLRERLPASYRPGDRLLIRTDWTDHYGEPGYVEGSPYLSTAAVDWCANMAFPVVGLDFAHTKDEVGAPGRYYVTRRFCEARVVTMGYVKNLAAVKSDRVLLVALPLAVEGAEASPVRAVVLDGLL